MKVSVDQLRDILRRNPCIGSADLCRLLKWINRSTLTRLVAQIDAEVIRLGGSRRSRYALRRSLRGKMTSFPPYRIDASGSGHSVGCLDLAYPEGSALCFNEAFPWPLDRKSMSDGWFDSLHQPPRLALRTIHTQPKVHVCGGSPTGNCATSMARLWRWISDVPWPAERPG